MYARGCMTAAAFVGIDHTHRCRFPGCLGHNNRFYTSGTGRRNKMSGAVTRCANPTALFSNLEVLGLRLTRVHSKGPMHCRVCTCPCAAGQNSRQDSGKVSHLLPWSGLSLWLHTVGLSGLHGCTRMLITQSLSVLGACAGSMMRTVSILLSFVR